MRAIRLTRVGRGERGAVLIIFAVFALVAVIMVAAVVDLGDQRQERKEVTLSTDSAALAAAGLANTEDADLKGEAPNTLVDCALVEISPEAANPQGFSDVQDAVDDFLDWNGKSQPGVCRVARTGFKMGYVVVSADETVEYAFGNSVGMRSGDVRGASVAAIEVDSGGGLRPIGMCAEMQSLSGVVGYAVTSLNAVFHGTDATYGLNGDGRVVNNSTSPPSLEPFAGRFPIDHVKGGDCGSGGGSGNFGQLDFGGNPSTDCDNPGHFCTDIRDGYYEHVQNPSKGETGANWGNNSTTNSMDDLLTLGQFWVPMVTSYSGTGNGAEATLAGFAQVEMLGYCTTSKSAGSAAPCQYSETGSPSDNTSYFDLKVSRMIAYPDWTLMPTDDAAIYAPRLCAMNNDPAEIAAGCPQVGVTPGPPSPPPVVIVTPCDVTGLSIRRVADPVSSGTNSLSIPKATGQRLSVAVALDVTVADPAHCSGLTLRFDERNGNGLNDVATTSPPSATFTVAEAAGETMYKQNTTYDVVAEGATGSLTIPAVSLTIQN